MAYTTINKPADYFNTLLWSGTGASNSLTGVGFEPDWTWIKKRSNTADHRIFDSVRGATKALKSNATQAEGTETQALTSFDSDGFTLGTDDFTNGSGSTFVGWNWLAGGTASSNTDGSITSSVSANTTSGFSIVSFTGTGANATVGHGLGSAPKMVIFKNRDNGTQEWDTYHAGLTNATYFVQLNSSNAQSNTNGALRFNSTAPTSSVFSVGTATTTNESSSAMIAYCFAEKKGFSKFGSYAAVLSPGSEALGSPFVYTGFKPAMVILKSYTHVESWHMKDATRDPFNYVTRPLYANLDATEGTMTNNGGVDFYSNGFGINYGTGDIGSAGKSYIYMAFAENPLVTTGKIPATAR